MPRCRRECYSRDQESLRQCVAFCFLLPALKLSQTSWPLPACLADRLPSALGPSWFWWHYCQLLFFKKYIPSLTLYWHLVQHSKVEGTPWNRCAHLALVGTQEPRWLSLLQTAQHFDPVTARSCQLFDKREQKYMSVREQNQQGIFLLLFHTKLSLIVLSHYSFLSSQQALSVLWERQSEVRRHGFPF